MFFLVLPFPSDRTCACLPVCAVDPFHYPHFVHEKVTQDHRRHLSKLSVSYGNMKDNRAKNQQQPTNSGIIPPVWCCNTCPFQDVWWHWWEFCLYGAIQIQRFAACTTWVTVWVSPGWLNCNVVTNYNCDLSCICYFFSHWKYAKDGCSVIFLSTD